MKNKKKEQIYNARILYCEETGTVKIRNAESRTQINQFRSDWVPIQSRELARLINRSKIVIK